MSKKVRRAKPKVNDALRSNDDDDNDNADDNNDDDDDNDDNNNDDDDNHQDDDNDDDNDDDALRSKKNDLVSGEHICDDADEIQVSDFRPGYKFCCDVKAIALIEAWSDRNLQPFIRTEYTKALSKGEGEEKIIMHYGSLTYNCKHGGTRKASKKTKSFVGCRAHFNVNGRSDGSWLIGAKQFRLDHVKEGGTVCHELSKENYYATKFRNPQRGRVNSEHRGNFAISKNVRHLTRN